jgi:hypothetical protein
MFPVLMEKKNAPGVTVQVKKIVLFVMVQGT